jgi:hypothetical protein
VRDAPARCPEGERPGWRTALCLWRLATSRNRQAPGQASATFLRRAAESGEFPRPAAEPAVRSPWSCAVPYPRPDCVNLDSKPNSADLRADAFEAARTPVARRAGSRTRGPESHPAQGQLPGRLAIRANTGRSSSCTRRNGWTGVSFGDPGRSRSLSPPRSALQRNACCSLAPRLATGQKADLVAPSSCLERVTMGRDRRVYALPMDASLERNAASNTVQQT